VGLTDGGAGRVRSRAGDDPLDGPEPEAAAVTGPAHPHHRARRGALVTATACDCASDCAQWAGRLNQLIAMEVRTAVADDVLTAAEGDQLLARLALVIDQAVTPARP
jgi:hypothetical protein